MTNDYEPEVDELTGDFLALIEKYKSMGIPIDLLLSNQIMNLFLVANMKGLKFPQLCEMVLRGSASYRTAREVVEGERI